MNRPRPGLAMVMLSLVARSAAAVSITQGPTVTVATNQVTISWRTDVAASSEVHYGPSSQSSASAYSNHSVFAQAAGSAHSRTLSDLAPGQYFFRVRAADA